MGKDKESLNEFTLADYERVALETVRQNCKGRAARLYVHGDSCKKLGGDYESAYQLAWAFDFVAWVCEKILKNGIPTRWRGGEIYVKQKED